jgi:TPR repeat protein
MKPFSFSTVAHGATTLLALSVSLASGAALAQSSGEYSLQALSPLPCDQMIAKLNTGLERKDPQALYSAGVIYEEGACVARDPAKAAHMMRGALDAGSLEAAASLALLTGLGEGVPQDYAAAGALLAKAGLKLGNETVVAGPDADYTRGYAYTWLRVAQRELRYPQELRATGTRGNAELDFEPRSGKWKTGTFRKTSTTEDIAVGSRIDRSRGAATAAIEDAAQAANAKVPAPDRNRVAPGSFSAKFTLAPEVGDTQTGVGVIPIIGNVPRSRYGTGG